jgi:hypothetical protein
LLRCLRRTLPPPSNAIERHQTPSNATATAATAPTAATTTAAAIVDHYLYRCTISVAKERGSSTTTTSVPTTALT